MNAIEESALASCCREPARGALVRYSPHDSVHLKIFLKTYELITRLANSVVVRNEVPTVFGTV
jgi:hypothetical protein